MWLERIFLWLFPPPPLAPRPDEVRRERLRRWEEEEVRERKIMGRYASTPLLDDEHEHCSSCEYPLYGNEIIRMPGDEVLCTDCLRARAIVSQEKPSDQEKEEDDE